MTNSRPSGAMKKPIRWCIIALPGLVGGPQFVDREDDLRELPMCGRRRTCTRASAPERCARRPGCSGIRYRSGRSNRRSSAHGCRSSRSCRPTRDACGWPHHLKALDADRRPQLTVVCARIDLRPADVADRLMKAAGLGHECGRHQEAGHGDSRSRRRDRDRMVFHPGQAGASGCSSSGYTRSLPIVASVTSRFASSQCRQRNSTDSSSIAV